MKNEECRMKNEETADYSPLNYCPCLNLECVDKSALFNWATCRPVEKRRHVAALQIKELPDYFFILHSSLFLSPR